MSELEPISFKIYGDDQILSPQDFKDFWDFQLGAFAVHLDRERIRRGLWKEYPALDQFTQVKIKVDRIINSLKLEEMAGGAMMDPIITNIVEESYDISNYVNFGARIVQGKVKP